MNTFRKFLAGLKQLAREEGQDLVEYTLVIALLAFSTTAGIDKFANNINKSFMKIEKTLTQTVRQALK